MRLAIWFGLSFNFAISGTGLVIRTYSSAPHIGQTWNDVIVSQLINYDPTVMPWAMVSAAANTVLDLYIFILPLPLISKLNLPLRKRIRVAFVFLTALL